MIVSRTRQSTAAAIIALAMLSSFAGAWPALAGVAAGESAFKNGDFLAAAREFQGPAYRGDPLAQYYLGVIYADGLGGDQSLEDGLAWLMCVQTGIGLPPSLKQDAKQRRRGLMSRVSSYAMEQAEMRASTLCGRTPAAGKQQAFTTNEDAFEDIRPVRGTFGTVFFFPGDTMVYGATVVFHEMGLIFLRDVFVGMVRLMGDLIFGLLSLIGWLLIGKIIYCFVGPLWKAIAALNPSSPSGSMDDPARSQTQKSNSN
jgi:hypothetical protein